MLRLAYGSDRDRTDDLFDPLDPVRNSLQLHDINRSITEQKSRCWIPNGPFVQFQKVLRLKEARQLMLDQSISAGAASAPRESASQFNREYRRLFWRSATDRH